MTVDQDPPERTYFVVGMTCGHCVASVDEELSAIAGVDGVDIDLPTGRVIVRGEGVRDADVRAAVAEAGYALTP